RSLRRKSRRRATRLRRSSKQYPRPPMAGGIACPNHFWSGNRYHEMHVLPAGRYRFLSARQEDSSAMPYRSSVSRRSLLRGGAALPFALLGGHSYAHAQGTPPSEASDGVTPDPDVSLVPAI